MRSLHVAGTGMLAQQTNVEVISNNIANMSTTGYKRRRAEFADLIYQNLRRTGSQSSDNGSVLPSGAQIGLGVKTSAIYRISEQGNLQQTENRFDLAIRGNGYFQIQLPSGEVAYTRDGTFGLAADGTIVTAEGFTVQPGITIPAAARDVTINAAGEVLAKIDGQLQPQNVGQVQLAIFPIRGRPGGDRRQHAAGDARFGGCAGGRARAARLRPVAAGLRRNFQRQLVQEITSLITAQRAYEMNSKVITASDEMLVHPVEAALMRALLLAALLVAAPAAAELAALRPLAVVDDATLRLGDLFEGAGDRASRAIGPAPGPGKRLVRRRRSLPPSPARTGWSGVRSAPRNASSSSARAGRWRGRTSWPR